MLQALRLDHYSGEMLLLILLGVMIGGIVIGYITDAVMTDRGFGPFGNGLLAIFGMIAGVYIRNNFFGRMEPGDIVVTGVFAAVAATLILLIVGVVKSWVSR